MIIFCFVSLTVMRVFLRLTTVYYFDFKRLTLRLIRNQLLKNSTPLLSSFLNFDQENGLYFAWNQLWCAVFWNYRGARLVIVFILNDRWRFMRVQHESDNYTKLSKCLMSRLSWKYLFFYEIHFKSSLSFVFSLKKVQTCCSKFLANDSCSIWLRL